MTTTIVDQILARKYKEMAGFFNIINISNNTVLVGNTTVLGNLINNNLSIFTNSCKLHDSFFISNITIINNNFNTFNTLSISGSAKLNNFLNINNNLTIKSNLHNKYDINCYGNGIINNIYLRSSMSILNNASINTIYTNKIYNDNTLNIYGNIINIGSSNSIININGTCTYILNSYLDISNNLINLNINATNLSSNLGEDCGFEILGTSGIGYIKTDDTGLRYKLKPPLDTEKYVSTLDNGNLNISGYSLFKENLSVNSSLFVYGDAIFNDDIYINGNLYISNQTTLNNDSTMLGNINVKIDTIFNSSVTTLAKLTVLGTTVLYDTNINSPAYIYGNTIIYGNTTITSSLNLFGTSLFLEDITIASKLSISGNTIINGVTNINSDANIYGDSIVHNNAIIHRNMTVSGKSIFNGNFTCNSSIYIAGNPTLQNDVKFGNIITSKEFTILGSISCPLREFLTNSQAALNGVPLWGFYRTGGIVKIRLDVIPPELFLKGPDIVIISQGNLYTDQGIIATDNIDAIITPYLFSISNNLQTNIITTPIIVVNETIIPNTDQLTIGIYTISYYGSDIIGNRTEITRTLKVI